MNTEQKILLYFVVAVALILAWINRKAISALFSGITSTGTTSATSTVSDTTAGTITQTVLQVTNPAGAIVYAFANNTYSPQVPTVTIPYGTLLGFTQVPNQQVKYYLTNKGWILATDVQIVNIQRRK